MSAQAMMAAAAMTNMQYPALRTALVLGLGFVAGLANGAGTGLQHKADWPLPVHDDITYGQLMFDRLEYQDGDSEDVLLWDAQAWYGSDYNRLWVETEGHNRLAGGDGGELEKLDIQYSHRFSAYWDVQAGLGYQTGYGPESNRHRSWAVIGFQGLAPYWFEVDSNLRLSEDGDAWADVELAYDWLFTQRLVLQPRLEAHYAFSDAETFGVGGGLSSINTGLRLRYHLRREIAPYIGIAWSGKFGDTADLARAGDGETEETRAVVGIRVWF